MKSFLIALQFLTRLPVRLARMPGKAEIGRSLLYYPLVGLCLGLILLGLAQFMAGIDGLLPAAIILIVWVTLTGALHLDGLADSADAWAGGMGDGERTLAIMQDPRSGPVAVVAVLLVLLLKFAALERLLAQSDGVALLLAPVLGRTAPLLLFLSTPYVRARGLGAAMAEHLPRQAGMRVVFSVAVLAGLFAGTQAVWAFLAAGGVWLGLRAMTLNRLGGFTGDVAGALVELVECSVLASLALAA